MFMVCDTKSGRYCTDLAAYTKKQQRVCVHAKCYNKKILFPTYSSGSTYQINFCIHLLSWLKSFFMFKVSDESW